MSNYLLDTNILIHFFRKTKGFLDLLASLAQDDVLYISVMTRLEIIRGMQEWERDITFHLLNSFETVDVTVEIANNAGKLIRAWRKRGVSLEDTDAIIAATALHHGLALLTTNAKHFPMTDLIVFQADEQGNITLRE
ncbi:MAG TPA: type II toxin-antitoxin system VapC family toxin [Anaerolineales bacterium]|nr:type II toxin-antitoxin system VapC family toxin [Anaerolineales bacterium]